MRKTILFFLVIFCFLAVSENGMAQFYKWVDENGVVHYSDTPMRQDKKDRKIEVHSIPGAGLSGHGDAGSAAGGGDWFNCKESSQRTKHAAAELLLGQGYSSPVVFNSYVHQSVDGFYYTLGYEAKLPDAVVKQAGCSSGYQIVKVRTETNSGNRTQCRILGVELGEKKLEPPSCRK